MTWLLMPKHLECFWVQVRGGQGSGGGVVGEERVVIIMKHTCARHAGGWRFVYNHSHVALPDQHVGSGESAPYPRCTRLASSQLTYGHRLLLAVRVDNPWN